MKNNNKIVGISVLVLLALVVIPTSATPAVHAQIILNNTNATTNADTNATTPTTPVANATAGGVITNLTWYENLAPFDPSNPLGNRQYGERVIPLSPENIQYQQTDPAFAKLAHTTNDCINHMGEMNKKTETNPNYMGGGGSLEFVEDIQRQDFCTDIVNQGLTQICEPEDFATFDIAKCEEARTMTEEYVQLAEALYG